ncbi:MAG: ABC transporter ATP-binding protein [Lachnospiraceae bacterium]|nr:ABC transporter ATP-binding protein [Lachnospiraceae bacterium]
MENKIIIRTENLHKDFILNKESKVSAIGGIDLNIEQGEFVAIVGRSGSGKSTLMQLLSGIILPTQGDVYYRNTNLNKLSNKERAAFRNKEIGFVFQSFFVEKNLTAYENVEIPLLIQDIDKKERERRIELALSQVGLSKRKDHKPREMSGGEIQRVCIARAMVTDPEVIFADEPTGQLDFATSEIIMELFTKMKNENKTVIMVTHNETDARKYADRLIRIQDGKITSEEKLKDEQA